MIKWIENWMGKKKVPFPKECTVIDVLSASEFSNGHIHGAINIPVDQLDWYLEELRQKQPLLVCCTSGMRSASATKFLTSKGLCVYDGGGWKQLEAQLA